MKYLIKINFNISLQSFLAVIVLALIFTGCSPSGSLHSPQIKDGKLYGVTSGAFRHQWWNYYERALSFADGQFWQEAESDLRAALQLRVSDNRRSRTYGMAYIEYFPHRELGIVLFKQGRLDEAMRELELSLLTERSAKAEYYLDKARKSWLMSNNRDRKSPEILLETPAVDLRTNRTSIVATGTVTDDFFVSEIRVNGQKVRMDVASPSAPFKMEVPIYHGANKVVIQARDLTGKVTVLERVVVGDRAGPIVNLDELKLVEGEYGKVLVQGYAYDSSLVQKIMINGDNIIPEPMSEVRINHIMSKDELNGAVTVIAEDNIGNKTTAELLFSGNTISKNPFLIKTMIASADPVLPYILLANTVDIPSGNIVSQQAINPQKHETYHAIIIGIDQYEEWTPLQTAVNDAESLGDILIRKYGFAKENVTYIINNVATRSTIIKEIRTVASRLDEKDNLLIYYAGHGQLDDLTDDGYWIPYNGKLDDPTTWVTHSTIKNILSSERVRGKNIVVIADSCYSGNLLRSGQNLSHPSEVFYLRRLTELSRKKSRQVISSGGIEPVADSGRDNHSLFAYYLLNSLDENILPLVDLENIIITHVWRSVSEKGGQRPTVGRLKTPMDEDGQFVLVLKDSKPITAVPTTDKLRNTTAAKELVDGYDDWLPDSNPPQLYIKGWREEQSVFQAEVLFEGKVFDESGVQNFTINGQNILRRPGKNIFYNYLAELKEGENFFYFKSVDQFGNKTERRIKIIRKARSVLATGSRMSTALYLEQSKDQQIKGLEDIIVKYMLESKRFDLKDTKWALALRNRTNQSDKILEEDLLDVAHSMEVDFVVLGKIVTNKDTLQISARVVETATSLIVAFEDVFGENVDQNMINNLCKGLVVKLQDTLPLVEGYIVKIKHNSIIVNLGQEHGIKKGMHLTFYEEKGALVDPVTGALLDMDVEELGEARIEKVKERISIVELLDGSVNPNLKVGHQLVMQ